jgi:uncharacterized membrane protein
MTHLDAWLEQAVRCLSRDSASQVRTEIQDHFESEREAAISQGASAGESERIALQALGDPREANRQYRRVLLSSSEAALLRSTNLEAHAICSTPWMKWAILASPGVLLLASVVLLAIHQVALARGLMLMGSVMAIVFIPPFLPIYTPARGRVFRAIKWTLIFGAVLLLLGRDTLQWSWLFASCFFPAFWTEWKRIGIRRKLPITQWPKQLYL